MAEGRIEPSIRKRVTELNEFARSEIEARGLPENARMHYIPFEVEKPFELRWNEGTLRSGTERKIVAYDNEFKEVASLSMPIRESFNLTTSGTGAASSIALMNPDARKLMEKVHGYIYRDMLETAKVGKEDKVLELGSGVGVLTEKLANRAGAVTAVDFARPVVTNLETLKQKKNIRNLEAIREEYLGLAGKPSWRYGQYDKVFSAFATESHPAPLRLFKMLRASLKPGGSLVLVEATPFHESLRGMLEKAGFEVKRWEVKPYARYLSKEIAAEGFYTLVHATKK